MILRRLSELSNSDFSKAVTDLYNFTKYNEKQYPNYYEWFYQISIPRVKKGNGEIFFYEDNNKIIGISILKIDSKEKKICTFYIDSKYRGLGLGSKLIKLSFDYLGTTKPLITIPVSRVSFFSSIISTYSWSLDGVINSYNEEEEVYNLKINE